MEVAGEDAARPPAQHEPASTGVVPAPPSHSGPPSSQQRQDGAGTPPQVGVCHSIDVSASAAVIEQVKRHLSFHSMALQIESDLESDCGTGESLSSMGTSGRSTPLTATGTPSKLGSGAAAQHHRSGSGGAGLPPGHSHRLSATDPDYEVPQGLLTETQVMMSQPTPVKLDRFGFVVTESSSSSQAAASQPALATQQVAPATQGRATPPPPPSPFAGSGGGGVPLSASEVQRRRVLKWRKMLGPNGSNLRPYMQVGND